MINRIEFDLNGDSIADIRCPINPVEVDLQQSIDSENSDTLDGEPVINLPLFDSRVRTLTWRNLPNRTPFSEMVSGLSLLQFLASGCQLNLRDIHRNIGNNEWTPIQVLSVDTSWRTNSASASSRNKLIYDKIEVKYIAKSNFVPSFSIESETMQPISLISEYRAHIDEIAVWDLVGAYGMEEWNPWWLFYLTSGAKPYLNQVRANNPNLKFYPYVSFIRQFKNYNPIDLDDGTYTNWIALTQTSTHISGWFARSVSGALLDTGQGFWTYAFMDPEFAQYYTQFLIDFITPIRNSIDGVYLDEIWDEPPRWEAPGGDPYLDLPEGTAATNARWKLVQGLVISGLKTEFGTNFKIKTNGWHSIPFGADGMNIEGWGQIEIHWGWGAPYGLEAGATRWPRPNGVNSINHNWIDSGSTTRDIGPNLTGFRTDFARYASVGLLYDHNIKPCKAGALESARTIWNLRLSIPEWFAGSLGNPLESPPSSSPTIITRQFQNGSVQFNRSTGAGIISWNDGRSIS